MSTNKMLEAALSYAKRGWNVFPVTANQKHQLGLWFRVASKMQQRLSFKSRVGGRIIRMLILE